MTTTMHGETITISYQPWNFDRLYSPDGRLHLLLCGDCHRPEWVEPNVDAVTCAACATGTSEEPTAEAQAATSAGLRLCSYHEDSLGWDDCTFDFEGCEIEQARARFAKGETK
jgi:hypothetical protein